MKRIQANYLEFHVEVLPLMKRIHIFDVGESGHFLLNSPVFRLRSGKLLPSCEAILVAESESGQRYQVCETRKTRNLSFQFFAVLPFKSR